MFETVSYSQHSPIETSVSRDMRANGFNALRLVGALLVIVGHGAVLSGTTPPMFLGIALHTLGVKLFFVISGFLITQSFARDSNMVRFALRRALRLFPALIVVVLLTILVCSFFSTSPVREYFRSHDTAMYLRNLVLLPYHSLPGVFANNPLPNAVNGSLWTLPVEAFMYALTPVLARTPKFALPCVLISALWLSMVTTSVTVLGFGLDGAADLIPYFLTGMFFARVPIGKWLIAASIAALLVATVVPVFEWIVVIPFSVTVLAMGTSRALPDIATDVSYGLYLLAFPVQQILEESFPDANAWILMLFTVVIALPLAWCSWHFIERPALKLKPRAHRTGLANGAADSLSTASRSRS